MDNEVKGTGVQYDYGFRIYDARIAKFLSVDPLTKEYPWYTPYQFAGNKPIKYIDLDGLEEASHKNDYNPHNIPSLTEAWSKMWEDFSGWKIFTSTSEEQRNKAIQEQKRASAQVQNLTQTVKYFNIGIASFPVLYGVSAYGALGLLNNGGVIFVTKGKDIMKNMAIDAGNQFIINGRDFDKIDWANVAASGLVKDKHLKNILASAFDYTKEKGADVKNIEDLTVEFLIRTGADQLFMKSENFLKKYVPEGEYPSGDSWKVTTDLLKKAFRDGIKQAYKEHKKETEVTAEK